MLQKSGSMIFSSHRSGLELTVIWNHVQEHG